MSYELRVEPVTRRFELETRNPKLDAKFKCYVKY